MDGEVSADCGNCTALQRRIEDQEREIAALRASIAEVRQHDPVTGALNEKGMLEQLRLELLRARRTGHPMCFGLMSVRLGDDRTAPPPEVLRVVAGIATDTLRALDQFGRLRNATFGILLPSTWPDQALIAVARLRAAFDGRDWGAAASGARLRHAAGLTTQGPTDTPALIVKRCAGALAQALGGAGDGVVQVDAPLPGC